MTQEELSDESVSEVGRVLGCPYATELVRDLPGDAAFPYPSPDGKKIAFQWNRSGNWDIYVLEIEADRLLPLTDHPARDESPCFSPSGRAIAFTSTRNDSSNPVVGGDKAQRDIFLVAAEGGKPVCIVANPADDWYPRFAPDGRSLFFVSEDGGGEASSHVRRQAELYRLWFATGQIQRLTANQVDDTAPCPDPGAKHLLFARAAGDLFGIYQLNLTSLSTTQLLSPKDLGVDEVGAPAIAAEGLLACVGRKGQNLDLYMFDLRSGRKQRLTRHPGVDQAPVFSAEGKALYFHSNRTGRFAIYRMDLSRPITRAELIETLNQESQWEAGSEEWNPEVGNSVYGGD
ncbi:MAG: hypothetical protein ONB23_06555 [candidate division KSB1 bacterium]|nr:hypothetical protein [candidate division KSB1 bacterium]